MRIALITDGRAVGADTSALATALGRLDHEPVVDNDISVAWRDPGSAVSSFVDRWTALRPDIVHCRSGAAGQAVVTAAGLLRIPVVHSVRANGATRLATPNAMSLDARHSPTAARTRCRGAEAARLPRLDRTTRRGREGTGPRALLVEPDRGGDPGRLPTRRRRHP